MFSRRHPYLFFILVFSSIVAVSTVLLSVLILAGFKGMGIDGILQSEEGVVGVIEVTGPIQDARNVNAELKRFREDENVRAVVIRIDSPGGAVGPSQEIYREIRKTLKIKKVVASMGTVAASGGYYIAAGADKIVANPGTITGSIGVIMGFSNYEQLLQKIGLVPIVVKSGRYKDIGSPVREMTVDERQLLEDFAGKIHRQFIQDIVDGRGMNPGRVGALADGRIFTGEESKTLGLVDRLGNLEDAIEWAGRLGGITGAVETVYAREKEMSFLEYLLFNTRLKIFLDRFLHPGVRAEYIYEPLGDWKK